MAFNLRNFFDVTPKAAPNFQVGQIQKPYGGANVNQIVPPQLPQIQRQVSPFEPPETPAFDRYRSWIDEYPQYQNPGVMTKIAAALAGFGAGVQNPAQGPAVARSVLDIPREKQLGDWAARGEGLKSAASLEGQNFGRENQFFRNIITDDYNQGRLQNTADANQIKRMQIEQNKPLVDARVKALGKGKFQIAYAPAGEKDQLFNLETGEVTPLDVDLSGPPERVAAQIQAAMERATLASQTSMRNVDVQQAGATERTGMQQQGQNQRSQAAIDAAAARQEQRIAAGGYGATLGRRNAALEALDRQDVLMQLSTKYPDIIKQTSQGKYYAITPEEPGGLWGEDLRPKFNDLLNDLKTIAPTPNVGPTVPPPLSSPTGMVKVQDPSGVVRLIPRNQLQNAIAAGGKQVP